MKFDELFVRLQRGRTELRRELAGAIQLRFNAYLKTLPQETYEQKHALASWVNHVLRVLDLALRCPRTGEPAILVAEDKDKSHPNSRFRFQGKGTKGKNLKTCPSVQLPDLQLIPAPVREEGSARWSEHDGLYRGPRNAPIR